MAYSTDFRGGVYVAVADLNGDRLGEVVTGAGVGGAPHVKSFQGTTGAEQLSFMAGSLDLRSGVMVGAVRMCGCPTGPADILTVVSDGGPSTVRSFDGETCEPMARTAATLTGVGMGLGSVAGNIAAPEFDPGCVLPDSFPYDNSSDPIRVTCGGPSEEVGCVSTPTGDAPMNRAAGNVRTGDGMTPISAPGLHMSGTNGTWGRTMQWSNGKEYDRGSFNGSGWVDSSMPSLISVNETDTLFIVKDAMTVQYFDLVSSTYVPRHFFQDTLTHDTTAKQFVWTDTSGAQWRFWDFTSEGSGGKPREQKGQFQSYTDPGGLVVQVTDQTSDNKIEEVQSASTVGVTTITDSYLYGYVTSGGNAGLISSVTFRRKINSGSWTTIRSVEYTYYNGTESYGNLYDLKTIVVKDGSGSTIDTSYYRYYTSNGSGGYIHGLKLAFGPDSYERLKAAYADPTTATHAQAAVFADHYLEYDGSKRVTLHTVQGEGCSTCTGGLGTYTYSYATPESEPSGYNAWVLKTVETLPDGHRNVYFTNEAGEVMMQVFQEMDGEEVAAEWITYHRYDDDGRLILTAQPSAMSGYDEDYESLVDNNGGNLQYVRDSEGFIDTKSYFSGTTTATASTAGNVDGYLLSTAIQRGETGTAVPQSESKYFLRTVSGTGITIYPLATSKVYRNSDGTGGQTTEFAYTWHTNKFRAEQITTTLPTVTTGQNGPNSADVSYTVYDIYGRMTWSKDADGFITYTAYDQATGAVIETIQDVDTSAITGEPSGWTTPGGGGLHLETDMLVDGLGRTTKITAPNGTVRYTVYKDAQQEVRQYAWDTSASQPIGPVTLWRKDRGRYYTESLSFTSSSTWPSAPDGTESITTVHSLTRSIVNDAGQTVANDQYFTLSGTSYSQTTATLGSAWTTSSPNSGNYYRTELAYDNRGRLKRVLAPTGTITRTVYDPRSRMSSSWIGTDDTPTSGFWSPDNLTGTNTVKVGENEYDAGGIGDSNLTKSTQFPNGTTNPRVTAFSYDWRNRRIMTKSGVEGTEGTSLNRPIFHVELDNLGQVIAREQYDGDTLSITTDGNSDGVPDRPSVTYLQAKAIADYDEQGRVYHARTYLVAPGTTPTTGLDTNTWFNRRGQAIKVSAPGGLVTKTTFDGAGRPTFRYTSDGGGDSGWSDADDVTGDAVLEQVETGYDGAGNVTLITTRQRFHDEADTGALGTPSSGVNARVSFVAYYYDKANRLTDTVNVGTDGDSAWTRPSTPDSRSDTRLVNSTIYDDAGRAWKLTDPRGLEARRTYDLMGRTTKTVENYVNGTPSDSDDKTVDYVFWGPRLLYTLTAQLTSGSQETKYIYGVSSSDGSTIASNDLLRATYWPNKSTGAASSSEDELSSYNAVGQRTTFEDRNGNIHAYSFDVVGRPTADAVTTVGSGVDGGIQRIETAYDPAGRAYLFTSYDDDAGGSIVNQVQRDFNGLGQITKEYQAHSGAVNTGTSPKVQYTYSEMASSANHSRLTSMVYPDGFTIGYNYASGVDTAISRLTSMTNSSTTLEGLTYLGLGTVVARTHPESGVDLTYIGTGPGEGGDQYVGLDRFGRIIDQRWKTTSTDKDRYLYGYDRNSNRLYRTNELDHTFDELYHADGASNGYDGLNQLSEFQRGTLSDTNSDSIPDTVSTASRYQTWDPDALGNFEGVNTDGTNQTRTHNKQNQSTVVGGNNLTFDNNGNTTTDETGRTLGWDAWNRLVKVNGTTRYAVDALGRRIKEGSTDLYYTTNWQMIEEQVSGTTTSHFVWSPVYVDALVLRERDLAKPAGVMDERLYVMQDANFNVTGLVNTSSTVVERFVQDPYGRFDVKDASWGIRASSSYAWVYLHQGGRWDATSALFNFRHRDYSPTLMRWVSVDPIRFASRDVNFYGYVGNDPTTARDSSGLKTDPINSSVNAYVGNHCGGRCGLWCSLVMWLNDVGDQITKAGYDAADALADEPGSGVVRGDPKHRAFRHCVASGLLALQSSCDCANCIGTAREKWQRDHQVPRQSEAEERIGVANNRAGLSCAGCRHAHDWYYINPEFRTGWKTADEIKKCCRDKLANGELVVKDPGGPRPRGGGEGIVPY